MRHQIFLKHSHSLTPEQEMSALSNLKIPMILGVVFIHSNILQHINEPSQIEGFAKFMALWNYILACAVPTFFFISGYLFFRSGLLTPRSFISKIKRRWHSLMIPYLIWNVIAMILDLIKASPYLIDKYPQYAFLIETPVTIFYGFFALPGTEYPYDMALWFLRNLIIISLLTPILSLLFHYLRVGALILLLCLVIFIPFDFYYLTPSLYFFALGAACPLLKIKLESIARYRILLTSVFVVLVVIDLLCTGYIEAIFYITAGILMFVAYVSTPDVADLHTDKRLREAIFFLYACHALYITVVNKFWLHLLPPSNSIYAAIDYIAIFSTLVILTLALYALSRRVAPRIIAMMCGGR